MEYNFTVQDEDSGKRIDLFLTSKIKEGCSRSFIQRLIAQNEVLLNNRLIRSHHKLSPGDSIRVKIPVINNLEIKPEGIKFEIIYEDDDILVINKPSGLVVHPAAGNASGTLANALLAYTKNLSDINPQRPGIVHRLDKETSGVMVIAKNNSAHLNLIKQFAKHKVNKKYIAIVKGVLEFDEGVIDLPIGRHSRNFRLLKVTFSEGSRDAITRYKVLKRFKETTLLELKPKTGRTHQLRVHLAHLGHPILGDSKYGRSEDFPRLALHAREIEFVHPSTNKRVTFFAELPKELL